MSPFFAYTQTDDSLTLEELAQTEAAQFYVSKQYENALSAFKNLEEQHPSNILIKRYIAKLNDILRQHDQAVEKLKEVLRMNSEDLIARQMLGDIYVKRAQFVDARQEFTVLLQEDPSGDFGRYAQGEIQKIDQLLASSRQQGTMPLSDFMTSEAAQAFSAGDYHAALEGFENLLREYPQDVLLHRFRGVALLRIEKPKEAVIALERALEVDSSNVAAHYYLGEAYAAMKKGEEARREYQWVIAHDEAEYRARAQQSLFYTLGEAFRPKPKKLNLSITAGYEFDTNATFKSNDDNFTTASDQNSGRYLTTIIGSYQVYQKNRFTMLADAFYAQNILNDFPTINTYTPGYGVSMIYAFRVFNKPVFFSLRDGQTFTLLKDKLFVFTNALSARFITSLNTKLRTSLGYTFLVSKYDSSGSFPPLTDRDGFGHLFSFSNTYYFNQARTFYASAGYTFERHDTEGNNFIRNVNGGNLGIHMPLLWRFEGDVDFRFRDSNYLKYGSTPPKRRDDVFTLSVTLSRPLTKHLTLLWNYVFEDSRAKNNLYEYTKHRFGASITYRY